MLRSVDRSLAVFEPPETELIGCRSLSSSDLLAFGSVLAMGLPDWRRRGRCWRRFRTRCAREQRQDHARLHPVHRRDDRPRRRHRLRAVHRHALSRGNPRPASLAIRRIYAAMDTAGRAVLFAGITVVVSLLGMLFIGLRSCRGSASVRQSPVVATLIAALTLLPALIGFAGDRVELTRWRGLIAAGFFALALLAVGPRQRTARRRSRGSRRCGAGLGKVVKPLAAEVPLASRNRCARRSGTSGAARLQARPWTALIVGSVILLILAAPLLAIRLSFADEGNFPEDTTTRQAYDLLGRRFRPWFQRADADRGRGRLARCSSTVGDLQQALAATDGVLTVSPPFPSESTLRVLDAAHSHQRATGHRDRGPGPHSARRRHPAHRSVQRSRTCR